MVEDESTQVKSTKGRLTKKLIYPSRDSPSPNLYLLHKPFETLE
jgi:hypothetical protein